MLNKKTLLELCLDGKSKLIVYKDDKSKKEYIDSTLCFYNGEKEYELINDSFAFSIGMGLYKRCFNINEYSGENFEKEFKDEYSQEVYERINRNFELSECKDYAMYLYSQKGNIIFLLDKLTLIDDVFKKRFIVHHKEFYKTEVSNLQIEQWKIILQNVFIPQYSSIYF